MNKIEELPKEIYLNLGIDDDLEAEDHVFNKDGVTWSEEYIFRHDPKYILESEVSKALEEQKEKTNEVLEQVAYRLEECDLLDGDIDENSTVHGYLVAMTQVQTMLIELLKDKQWVSKYIIDGELYIVYRTILER